MALRARHTVLLTLVLFCAGCARLGGSPLPAPLVGTLWWVTPEDAHRSIDEWQPELDAMQRLGLNLLVLNGPFVGEDLSEGQDDPMDAFFAELDRRGMHVYLDMLAAPQWWTLDSPDGEIARARERVRMLHDRFAKYRCFAGYYIPYELYVMWDEQADLIRTLYREVSAVCKEVAPDKKTLISPFFILDEDGLLGDFRWATPKEYEAFWFETLRDASIDIVALQDSGEHLSYYTLDDRKPFFKAMRRACDGAGVTLWANVELGELHVGNANEYEAFFGRKTHVNDPKTATYWRAVPADKLRDKLGLAGRYSPTAISWGYREYVRPSLGADASNCYLDYYMMLRSRE